LKEVALGQRPLHIWVFVAKNTDKFILRQDILCTHDTYVNLKHHVVWLGKGEVSRWLEERPWSFPHTMASDEVMIVMWRSHDCRAEGLHDAKTIVGSSSKAAKDVHQEVHMVRVPDEPPKGDLSWRLKTNRYGSISVEV
jgi:hypothetical protein